MQNNTNQKQTPTTNNQRVKKALANFGLSQNEIAIFTEALKHEETSPYALARATKIPRTTVYDVLMSLSLKGLVTLNQSDGFSKQQTKIKAKNPSILRTILKNRRDELTSAEVDIVEILPILKGDYHQDKSSSDFQFFPGIKGAENVYFHKPDSQLPKVVWENLMPMDAFGKDPMNFFTKVETDVNIAKGIDHREIIPLTEWTKHVLSYQYGLDKTYIDSRQMRYIDNPIFDLHLSITVQGTRTYITCSHQDEAWGLIINSIALSAALRAMFELQWISATPITHQIVKSWGKNEYLKQEKKKSS